jgi:pimeloyl-ACP methyl ester carboxylesterase
VYTPTLTGLGERSHLINRDVNLDTHITDVVNVFKWEGVANAVLCGHSYGGWVISGATEQVLPQVASIVFLPEPDVRRLFRCCQNDPRLADVRRSERSRCDGRYARTTRGSAARARVSAIRGTCGRYLRVRSR